MTTIEKEKPKVSAAEYFASAASSLAISAASLAGKPVPPRPWHVDGLIPAKTVTLLNADGGTGKSLISLQLAVATVLARQWLGLDAKAGSAIFLTAEDDEAEIHRRLIDVANHENVRLEDLDKLTILPLAGRDAVLASYDGSSGHLKTSRLYGELEMMVKEQRPALLVVDTLADVFAGDEIKRVQARQFIGLLRSLAIEFETTVLVLAHPSVAGMTSGTGSSGSTAWSNSVRSRLYMDRVKNDYGGEDDPDARVLTTKKANYGRTGEDIRLKWQRGVFVREVRANGSLNQMAAEARAETVFMDLLTAYEVEGRNVTATPCSTYAPAMFVKDKRAEGIGKRALEQAMNRLFAERRIKVEEFGPASKRRNRLTVNNGEG